MTLDRILAVVALATMIAFLATLVGFVRELDLTIIVVAGVGLAVFDFARRLR